MKAISIIQPWAELIVLGHKDIENRTWPTKVRGRVAVHASKKYDIAEWRDAIDCISETRELRQRVPVLGLGRSDVAYGAVIGTVEIVDCVTASSSLWFFGEFGFVLANPVKFAEPIPCRGSLGFWEFPEVQRG